MIRFAAAAALLAFVRLGVCASVPAEAISRFEHGYLVVVRPGEHPYWPADRTTPLVLGIGWHRARSPPDGHAYLCLSPKGDFLGFYAVAAGA